MNSCKLCQSKDLKFIESYVHEDVETNQEITHNVHLCNECGAIHYKENGNDVVEFYPNWIKSAETIANFVTDYDVVLEHKRKQELKDKEYAEEI